MYSEDWSMPSSCLDSQSNAISAYIQTRKFGSVFASCFRYTCRNKIFVRIFISEMSLSFNESVVYVVSKHLCSKKKIPESFILSSQYSGRLACCLNAQLLDREVKITPLS